MRILIVSQYFYPETFRINDVVKELIKRGHAVTVLTGLPNYPEGKIYDGYEKSYQKTEDYFGALVYRCKMRPRKKGLFNLLLNYLSFVKQAKRTLKHIKPDFDVIFFYEPSPISSGIPAVWYGKKYKIKTVIYNMDIWPDCVRDLGSGKVMSRKTPIFLFSKILSKYVYRRFDLIINKCNGFGNYLYQELSIPRQKMITLFEHAEDLYLSVNEQPTDNSIIDFMFLGNIGQTQNCDQIVRAFSRIDTNNCLLHFVGDGSFLPTLKELVSELGLENKVIFHGKKTVEETIGLYNLADVCLLSLSNKTASGLTPPGKLFSYMAASRLIIASVNGETREIIEKSGCGLSCPADEVECLSSLLSLVANDYEHYRDLGKNGRAYFIENFTLKKHVDSLESILLRECNI